MKISTIANTDSHALKFYEFTAPTGRLITAFFQVVDKQGKSIGCRDTYDAGIALLYSTVSN